MNSSLAKLGVGFLLGATEVGGVATAATNEQDGTKVCVDN